MLILKLEERSKNTDSLFDEFVLKSNHTVNYICEECHYDFGTKYWQNLASLPSDDV